MMNTPEHRYMNIPEHRYLPANGIWHWTTERHIACVCIVNDEYSYQIFCKVTGSTVRAGAKQNLADAKAKVFTFMKVRS